jgi:hypothetical protein
MGDLDVALFDVDVWGAVLPHGPQFHEMDRRIHLRDGIEQVERADHVVHLGVDGMLAVDHGVRGAPLLREVDDGVGPEAGHHVGDELLLGQVADEDVDALARDLLPAVHPTVQRGDGHEGVHPHFQVVAPPGEIVGHSDVVARP